MQAKLTRRIDEKIKKKIGITIDRWTGLYKKKVRNKNIWWYAIRSKRTDTFVIKVIKKEINEWIMYNFYRYSKEDEELYPLIFESKIPTAISFIKSIGSTPWEKSNTTKIK